MSLPEVTPSPVVTPTVDARTRRALRRAALAVLVEVDGYEFVEPGGEAAAAITGLALPVVVDAFGGGVPPGILMREVWQGDHQYGFVLVSVVPRPAADQELADDAAFRMASILAQLTAPPIQGELAGRTVNRLQNAENEAHVVTWAPDGTTMVAVVVFGPDRADVVAEGIIRGAR